MSGDNIETITKLAHFYGKWPGNYLKDLGYAPDLQLQKQLLIQSLGCSDLDETLKELGWVKLPEKDCIGKKKIERAEHGRDIGEDPVWNT